MDASWKASALRLRFSQSLASRRQQSAFVGLDDEALHPMDKIGQDAGQGAVKDRALIGAVGEQFPAQWSPAARDRRRDPKRCRCVSTRTCRCYAPASKHVAVNGAPLFQRFSHSDVDGRPLLEVERKHGAVRQVIMHGASGRQGSARHWQPVLRMYITVDHLDDAPFAAAGLARRDQRLDMIPHRSGRSDNAVCRTRAVVGNMVTSRANSPPQRITADSALQEGPPDNSLLTECMPTIQ